VVGGGGGWGPDEIRGKAKKNPLLSRVDEKSKKNGETTSYVKPKRKGKPDPVVV